MERADTKVNIFNIVPSDARGSRGHSYGFAADLRLRYIAFLGRRVEYDRRSPGYKGRRASYKRIEKETWEFRTIHKGRLYHVTVTGGHGGFVIVQEQDTMRVVCVMPKMTNQVLINKWQAKNYHALRQEAVK